VNAAPTLAECVEVLEARRLAVCGEMEEYGSPVAACDADFNALVMERAELSAALARLKPLARQEVAVPHPRGDHWR
jgi:hypothetical protein